MAFTVTSDGTGYRISIGDGKPAKARNILEVCEALRHFYAAPYHSAPEPSCPFCRQMQQARG